jgi:hypothetical protein
VFLADAGTLTKSKFARTAWGCAFAHEGLQCCLDFVALSAADAASLLRRCVNERKIEGSAKANNKSSIAQWSP